MHVYVDATLSMNGENSDSTLRFSRGMCVLNEVLIHKTLSYNCYARNTSYLNSTCH